MARKRSSPPLHSTPAPLPWRDVDRACLAVRLQQPPGAASALFSTASQDLHMNTSTPYASSMSLCRDLFRHIRRAFADAEKKGGFQAGLPGQAG